MGLPAGVLMMSSLLALATCFIPHALYSRAILQRSELPRLRATPDEPTLCEARHGPKALFSDLAPAAAAESTLINELQRQHQRTLPSTHDATIEIPDSSWVRHILHKRDCANPFALLPSATSFQESIEFAGIHTRPRSHQEVV